MRRAWTRTSYRDRLYCPHPRQLLPSVRKSLSGNSAVAGTSRSRYASSSRSPLFRVHCTAFGHGAWRLRLRPDRRCYQVRHQRTGSMYTVYYGTRTERTVENPEKQATALCAVLNALKAKRAPWRRTGPRMPSSTTTVRPDQLQLSPCPPEPSRSRHLGVQRHERWLHQSRAVPVDVLQNPDAAPHVAVSADVAGEPSLLGSHPPARLRARSTGLGADAAVVHVSRVLLALLCARIAGGGARSTQLGGERTAA